MDAAKRKGDGKFPTTEWTLVARLQNPDTDVSTRALDELCAVYHFPLYCFIRCRGLNHHDAEDALHDFLAKLLRLGAFEDLASEKGRLRTFLAKSLQRFLINRHHRNSNRAAREVAIEADHFAFDPNLARRYERAILSPNESPDLIFDRQWCAQLLQHVLDRLAERYQENGKAGVFKVLKPVLLSGGSLRDHDSNELAAQISMTPGALRVALLRLLRDYRQLLVEEVRQTVASKDGVDAELAELSRLMAGA